MLAMQQSLFSYPIMLIGAGQVQNHFHLRIVKGFVHIFIDYRFGYLSTLDNSVFDVL